MKSLYQDKTFAEYWNKRAGDEGEDYKKYVLDPLMFKLIGDLKNKVILELGCGNGYLAKKFLQLSPQKIILMDISEHNINYAKQKIHDSKANFIVADATSKWDISSNSIDVIYSNMMLNEVEDIKTPISESYRVLKTGGTFVFSVTHPAWDLYTFAQEQAGVASKKIKGLGGYFRKGSAKFIMGIDSKTNPNLAKNYNVEFEVQHYQRTISDYFNLLVKGGFNVRAIHEPELTKELLKNNHRFISYKDHPIGLVFFALKD